MRSHSVKTVTPFVYSFHFSIVNKPLSLPIPRALFLLPNEMLASTFSENITIL